MRLLFMRARILMELFFLNLFFLKIKFNFKFLKKVNVKRPKIILNKRIQTIHDLLSCIILFAKYKKARKENIFQEKLVQILIGIH